MYILRGVLLLFFETSCVYGGLFNIVPTNKNAGLNIYQLAHAHGYPLESHKVETQDGYILTMHRIPHGLHNLNQTHKSVVLLMHGLISSSVDWINAGPGNSLAYLLADQGYDVWMGNARGNSFSRKHKSLNPDKDKQTYWDFSWHEIGYYDLPAMIDYALANTTQKQLQFIGFSQGATVFLVLASTRTEYNEKIKFCTLLAPPGELSHIKQPLIKFISKFERIIYRIFQMLGIYEILPKSKFTKYIVFLFCDHFRPTQFLCKFFVYSLVGRNSKQLDGNFLPVIASNFPAGSSFKQFVHYAQVINGSFRKFDFHNKAENIKHYGSPESPKYDLGAIVIPVAIFYGANDLLVSDIDAKLTAVQMPNVVHLKEVEDPAWTHYDFCWARNVTEILYNEVVVYINKYN